MCSAPLDNRCPRDRVVAGRKEEPVDLRIRDKFAKLWSKYFGGAALPDFEYFLFCGIPGKLEGERYKKSPEIVREMMQRYPVFDAPARYALFKRWDKLDEADDPEDRYCDVR